MNEIKCGWIRENCICVKSGQFVVIFHSFDEHGFPRQTKVSPVSANFPL